MKCKKHFKKLSATLLASAFSLTIFVQGTLAVTAAEEPAALENAVNSTDEVSNEGSNTDKGNELSPETTLDSGSNGSSEDNSTKEPSDGESNAETTPPDETTDKDTEDAPPKLPTSAETDLPDNAPDENTQLTAPDNSSDRNDKENTADTVPGNEEQEKADDTLPDGEELENVTDAIPIEEKILETDEVLKEPENTVPLAPDYVGVSDLEWKKNFTVDFKFKRNDSTPGFYVVRIYRDGITLTNLELGDLSGVGYYSANVRHLMTDSGDYTFQIKISPDDNSDIYDFSSGYVSEMSPVFHYDKPAESLSVPTGLQWDIQTKGLAKWNAVENAGGYSVLLYKNNKLIYGTYDRPDGNNTQFDFSNYIGDEGSYTFRVQAISSDITQRASSEWSADSVPLGSSNEVDKTLEEILQNANVVEAVNDLKDEDKVNKSELKIAMQSDSDIQSKLQQLESRYIKEQGITVSFPSVEDVSIAPERISVLGAGLNAGREQQVTLKISRPSSESPYNPDVYKNVVQFNMELLIDGTVKKELEVPVTITLPVPDGMNIDRLCILHYSSSDGSYETILPRKNGNGTVSFTITHFSTFAFAEPQDNAVQETINTNKKTSSSRDTSGNETEILSLWKPTTPEEIKRYACKGNELIDYTQAEGNAYPVTIMNAIQGSMCFASFEAVLDDYAIGRTYNIYPSGNMTYSMDKDVEITLKIPSAIYQPDREYKMICVTKGGQPIIYEDLDKVPETITFKTNTFYAFALIYK
ncbi:MAG: hypothetical protein K2O16_02235 [Lachnospiraceae bacterium]|nr:hypothetical protein [Lachnospiraceae bacterium]